MTEFIKFPKIARFSRDVIVTEKIDGTNAQVYINEDGEVLAGSRNRWITPENDNYGFANWVYQNKEMLKERLGVGRHFGEWWGQGIQRRYNKTEKVFSLFNVDKYKDCGLSVVPILWRGLFDKLNIEDIMMNLHNSGSVISPGFLNPEGIVIYHPASNAAFKKTFEKDEGKEKSQ